MYIKFYAHCIPVLGASSGCIYDLQRGCLYNVPNAILELLLKNQNTDVNSIIEKNKTQTIVLQKYLDFFLENELIFYTDEPKNFPPIELNYRLPFELDTVYLEIEELQKYKISFLETQVEGLGVTNIVFIANEIPKDFAFIDRTFDIFKFSRIQYISFILPFDKKLRKKINSIHKNEFKIFETIFYNAPKTRKTKSRVYYYTADLNCVLSRTVKDIADFHINRDLFILSNIGNPHYYRSAYIDNRGDLKNSKCSTLTYGNIFENNLADLIKDKQFRKVWYITKDKIEVCKDCQYRYICNDTRIPEYGSKGQYTHTSKCVYNPYEDKWYV